MSIIYQASRQKVLMSYEVVFCKTPGKIEICELIKVILGYIHKFFEWQEFLTCTPGKIRIESIIELCPYTVLGYRSFQLE